MTDAAFNLLQLERFPNWYDHLPQVDRAIKQAQDDWAVRRDYGWDGDDGGEWGPNPLKPGEDILQQDWEETLALPFPEDFTEADRYVYELMTVIGKYQDKFLAEGEITREAILAWAKTAGVDAAKFTAELDAPATEQLVKRDVALAKALGVYGTPSFVVNGQLMQGGQTAQIWEKRVAEETTRADGLLSTGTRREDLIKAMVAVTNAKGLKDYEKYVLNGEPAPEAPVPAKVARNSGVASATAIGQPTRRNSGTSGRSSPSIAHMSANARAAARERGARFPTA